MNLILRTMPFLLVAAPVLAAGSIPHLNIRTLLWDLFVLGGVALIAGIAYYLIEKAPFIDAMFKTILQYAILLVLGILVIYLILGWIGM